MESYPRVVLLNLSNIAHEEGWLLILINSNYGMISQHSIVLTHID